jgi:hypothetical protein
MRYHSSADLLARGLDLPDPETVRVGTEVELDRLSPGARLHPFVRVEGARSYLGEDAEVGSEGGAFLSDVALGPGARVASGSVTGATLFAGATLGPASHVRAGTILEEGASTGHAVGLKQSLILAFGTLGSNVNFCDCLLAGGRSRSDHSEVGSGFIHFNFTPFGRQGDKATASLFGDVPRGVFMRENRVFLGGAGGVVGPAQVGFGSVLGAGSVYRRSYGEDTLVYAESLPPKSLSFDPHLVRSTRKRFRATLAYLGQIEALEIWYREVRRRRARDAGEELLLDHALANLEAARRERWKQGDRLAANLAFALESRPEAYGAGIEVERASLASWEAEKARAATSPPAPPASLQARLANPGAHLEWLAALPPEVVAEAQDWLSGIASSTLSS